MGTGGADISARLRMTSRMLFWMLCMIASAQGAAYRLKCVETRTLLLHIGPSTWPAGQGATAHDSSFLAGCSGIGHAGPVGAAVDRHEQDRCGVDRERAGPLASEDVEDDRHGKGRH